MNHSGASSSRFLREVNGVWWCGSVVVQDKFRVQLRMKINTLQVYSAQVSLSRLRLTNQQEFELLIKYIGSPYILIIVTKSCKNYKIQVIGTFQI